MSADNTQDDAAEEEDDDLRYFVRIGTTDLDGTKTVERSLTDMKGIGERTARIITDVASVDRHATFGLLEEDEIDSIIDAVENLDDHIPGWMTNRRDDFFSGDTDHKTGSDLEQKRRHDINRMKMIDSYKGVRHKRGQKVRGQRTKSTGRTEGTIGVNVEAIKEEAAEAAEEEE